VGISPRLAMRVLPEMSRPNGTSKGVRELAASSESQQVAQGDERALSIRHLRRRWRSVPESGRECARRARPWRRPMSLWSDVTLETLTPGPSSSS